MSEINKNNKIVAFVGLTGSGKSTAVNYLTDKGYPKVDFNDIISNFMNQAKLEYTEENELDFRKNLYQKDSENPVIESVFKQIHDLFNAGQHHIVVDGLYSWSEYKTLKKEFPGELTIIAIMTPKKLRHHRLAIRNIRPLPQNEADQLDWLEIEDLEKGGPIAIADHFIGNDKNLDHFYQEIDKTLMEINFFD